LDASFHERYASLSDDDLLRIAGSRRDLLKEAAVTLDDEMTRRGLTYEQARARKREHFRLDIEEARAYRKRKKSKYFVTQMNLFAYFIGLAGLVVVWLLAPRHTRVPNEWEWPATVVYLGALIACLIVQPWVRRTVSFWFSLVVSFVPQFLVAHWLAVHDPAHSENKGSAAISTFAGYVLGAAVFLLLQKLKPRRQTNGTD
jgi:hypothetical protein